MSESYTRICFLLASAGFRERELEDFAIAIKETGLSAFLSDVLAKRSIVQFESRGSRGEERYPTPSVRSPADSFSAKVVQLLVVEAKMTKLEAAEALRMELSKKGGMPPPPLGKRAFVEWLGLLSRVVSPSEILHLATRIRNQYVHESGADWSLK